MDSIDFYRRTFLSTKRGQLAVALASYMLGKAWESDITGERFDHGDGREDVVASGTLLPDEAPAAFYDQDGNPDASRIWNAGDAAEVSSNKRNKAKVWKKRGQIAMHVIAALPFDATDEIREAIARIHAEEHCRRGAAVTWAIHRPEPGSRNYHLHMLISTRRVTKDGFGKKIRGLAAAFSRGKGHQRATIHRDAPYKQWRALIERVAAEHGWSLELGVSFAIGGVHWGHGPRGENSRNRHDDAAAKAAARALLLDPKNLLSTITTRQAVFTRRDLYRLLRRHDVVDEEAESIVARALGDPEILRLAQSPGGTRHDLFTTRTVRAQEQRIVDAAARNRLAAFQSALDAIHRSARKGRNWLEDSALLPLQATLLNGLAEPKRCGCYRTGGMIIQSPFNGERHDLAVAAAAVPAAMEEFTRCYDSRLWRDLHPLLRAGLAHCSLAGIHGFSDGNGRLARLLLLTMLIEDRLPALPLEVIFYWNRRAYIRRTDAAVRKADLLGFMQWLIEAAQKSVELGWHMTLQMAPVRDQLHRSFADGGPQFAAIAAEQSVSMLLGPDLQFVQRAMHAPGLTRSLRDAGFDPVFCDGTELSEERMQLTYSCPLARELLINPVARV